jgi:hypothetical protein
VNIFSATADDQTKAQSFRMQKLENPRMRGKTMTRQANHWPPPALDELTGTLSAEPSGPMQLGWQSVTD